MIKAIETHYKGYRFRSRLEARWAAFFDSLGIEYQYEPQGFEYSPGDGSTFRYLPDFFLPASQTWVEVKGTDEAWRAAYVGGLSEILDYSSPLPGMCGSYCGSTRGLLILGDIPFIKCGFVAHSIIQHHKGLYRNLVCFTDDGKLALLSEPGDSPWGGDWSIKGEPVAVQSMGQKLSAAYLKARAARFEHGECPA